MAYLVDTNILLRWAQPHDPQRTQALAAVDALFDADEDVYVTAQNLIEFWNVVTRPRANNGLGLTPVQADEQCRELEAIFPVLPDTPAIYTEWRRLVVAHNVIGVQVHDTRLAAVMRLHGVSHLLTFNVRDFARFGGEGISVVHPADVPAVQQPAEEQSAPQQSAPQQPASGTETKNP